MGHRPCRLACLTAIPLLACVVAGPGCGPSQTVERTGEAARREVPSVLSSLLPPEFVLCHHRAAERPAPYDLWIVRAPSPFELVVPETAAQRRQMALPAASLIGLMKVEAPWLDPGAPTSSQARFSRWHADDADYQVREMTTASGWFASLERIGH
jgi:hypothetical protein